MGRRDFELLAKRGGSLRELLGAEARKCSRKVTLCPFKAPTHCVRLGSITQLWVAGPQRFPALSKYLHLACDLGCEGQEFPTQAQHPTGCSPVT